MPVVKLPLRAADDQILPTRRVVLIPGGGGVGEPELFDEAWACFVIDGGVAGNVFANDNLGYATAYSILTFDGEAVTPGGIEVPGANGGTFTVHPNGDVAFSASVGFDDLTTGNSRVVSSVYTADVDGVEHTMLMSVTVYG